MKPFLTIAIPTYNRGAILSKNLAGLFEYPIDNIEIIVSDNGSSDKTRSVCEQYAHEHQNFRYYRNAQNLGYDKNVLNCLARSEGEYVWFVGDDDFANSDLVSSIVVVLQRENPAGALINATVVNPINNQVLIENLGGHDRDSVVVGNEQAFVDLSKWATLISAIVVKRSLVRADALEEYVGSCFVQIPIFWRAVSGGKICVMGRKKLLKNDTDVANFNMNSTEIWLFSWIKTIMSLSDIFTLASCKESAAKLYPREFYNPGSLLMHIVQAKVNGTLSKANKHIIFDGLLLNYIDACFIELMVFLPSSLVSFLFNSTRLAARYVRCIYRKIS